MQVEDIIKKLCDELSNIIEIKNEELNKLKENSLRIKYIKGLTEVLEMNKIGFCKEFTNSKEEKKKYFISILQLLYNDEESIERIITSINDYNNISIKELDNLLVKLKTYLKDNYNEKISIKTKELKEEIKRLLELGKLFDGNYLNDALEDIDTFSNFLDISSLSDIEKLTLIEYVLIQSTKMYELNDEVLSPINEEYASDKSEIEEMLEYNTRNDVFKEEILI